MTATEEEEVQKALLAAHTLAQDLFTAIVAARTAYSASRKVASTYTMLQPSLSAFLKASEDLGSGLNQAMELELRAVESMRARLVRAGRVPRA